MKHRKSPTYMVAVLIAGFGLLSGLGGCTGASSATATRTSDSASVASPGTPKSGATPDTSPAPGSERVAPDQHPEQAHLTRVTVDSLADAITSYVQTESERRGGVFPVPDPERGADVELTMTTVHRERVSRLADGRYFACADFKGRDGRTYDVDIFMRADSGGLVPTDLIVHKVNGTPRFNWSERDGVWTRTSASVQ